MRRRSLFLLGVGAFAVYALTAPSVVGGDGVGYLRAVRHDPFPPPVPGHLLYLPLLSALAQLSAGHTLVAARLWSAASAALGVLVCAVAFHRLVRDERAALLSAAGLAVSYGFWIQGADVETYAAAALPLCAAFERLARWEQEPRRRDATLAGALVAVAALFHVAGVLFFPCVATWLGRRRRAHAALACGVGIALVSGAYAAVAFGALGLSADGAWDWFRGAGHGFFYSIRPYNLTDAVLGLAKSLVHAPYLHEADASVVLGQHLFGVAALGVVLSVIAWRRAALAHLPRAPLIAWAAPYALLGLLFFAPDTERWIFVLPLLWLAFAAAIASLEAPRRRKLGRAVVVGLFGVNFFTALLPGMLDDTPRWKAGAVDSQVRELDLVIFPGHDWDEYIGFYARPKLRVFPLAFHVGALGKEAALRRLEDHIRWARRRGGDVYVVRVLDDDPGPHGWDQLGLLGLGRAEAARYFRDHWDVTEIPPVRGVRMFRLEDTPRTPPRSRPW